MIVFICCLLIMVLTYPFIGRKIISVSGTKINVNNKKYIKIIALMLIFISGFRGIGVGIDTYAYYNSFIMMKNMSLSDALSRNVESGYILFQYIISNFIGSYQIFLIIVAVFFIGVVSNHIYKYSKNPLLSYMLFMFYGFFTFSLSATRQVIAIAFIMIAFEFIKRKELFKYLVFIALASSFHITALIFLPAYWFNKFKLNRKNLFIFLVGGLIIYGLRYHLRSLMIYFSRLDYTATETGGHLMLIFMILTVIIGVIFRREILISDENNKYLLFMMIASAVIMPITQFHPVVMRLYYYYFIFMITFIPNLLYSIKDKAIRYAGAFIYIVIGAYWFFDSIIKVEQLEEYMFFWQ